MRDLILFDDLVAPDVLDFARREARRLLVGKTGRRPSCKQDDINALRSLAGETPTGPCLLIVGRVLDSRPCEAGSIGTVSEGQQAEPLVADAR
jgi:siroheme synthase